MDWAKLVKERNEWIEHNFPTEGVHISALGVVEELGELVHAHIKEEAGIRTDEDHIANAKDAIGDMIVYLLGIMDEYKVLPYEAYQVPVEVEVTKPVTNPVTSLHFLSYHTGMLNLPLTTSRIGSNHGGAVTNIVYYCRRYCAGRYWNFEEIVQDTWDSVKARDWQKNKVDGS